MTRRRRRRAFLSDYWNSTPERRAVRALAPPAAAVVRWWGARDRRICVSVAPRVDGGGGCCERRRRRRRPVRSLRLRTARGPGINTRVPCNILVLRPLTGCPVSERVSATTSTRRRGHRTFRRDTAASFFGTAASFSPDCPAAAFATPPHLSALNAAGTPPPVMGMFRCPLIRFSQRRARRRPPDETTSSQPPGAIRVPAFLSPPPKAAVARNTAAVYFTPKVSIYICVCVRFTNVVLTFKTIITLSHESRSFFKLRRPPPLAYRLLSAETLTQGTTCSVFRPRFRFGLKRRSIAVAGVRERYVFAVEIPITRDEFEPNGEGTRRQRE